MPVKLTDKVYNEGGSPVQGAVAQAVLTDGTTTSVIATDITDTRGIWAFDGTIAGHQPDLADPPANNWYDVRINVGMQYRLRYGAIKAMMNMVYLAQNIVLGAAQTLDASLAALRVPAKTADPGTPGSGQMVMRTDTKTLRVYDGTAWQVIGPSPATTPETLFLGTTAVTTTNYSVAAGIMYVFCNASVTVTLPAAASTSRPITVCGNAGLTITVTSLGGSVNGGSANQTTGAIQNGIVGPGEAFTWKSDTANWRAV